jgi:hypothetical protein
MNNAIIDFFERGMVNQRFKNLMVFNLTHAYNCRKSIFAGSHYHLRQALQFYVKAVTSPISDTIWQKFLITFVGIINSIKKIFNIIEHNSCGRLLGWRKTGQHKGP